MIGTGWILKIGQSALFGLMLGAGLGATVSVGRSFFLGKDSIFYGGRDFDVGAHGVLLSFVVILLLDIFIVVILIKLRNSWQKV